MIEIAIVLVLALHLMCVNVAAAGPLVCLGLEIGEARGDALAGRTGRYLAHAAVVLFCLGMLLGLVLTWLIWDDAFRGTLRVLPRRVAFGVAELVFSLVLMAAHAVWWRRAKQPGPKQRILRCLLPFLSGTNLLYHFPFLFFVISDLAAGGNAGTAPLDSMFRQLIVTGPMLARFTHFSAAAFAFTGVVLIGYALRVARHGEPEDAARVASWGGWLGLVPTVAQLPAGIWLLSQLPRDAIGRLMGGHWLDALLFLSSLVLAFLLMHKLAAIATRDADRRTLVQAMCLMFVVIVLMTGVLRRTKPPRATPVAGQDGPVHFEGVHDGATNLLLGGSRLGR